MAILFIGAHPDDIELSCAGAICYFIEKNEEVFCYHLTNGVYRDIDGNLVRDLDEILETTKKSLGLLGVKGENIYFSDVPATKLQVTKENISKLQKFILKNNVKMIFTHPDPDTYHQDHRAAHNISLASSRRYVNNIFLFEIIFNFAAGLLVPNYYIDISKYIEKKSKSLRLHKSEYEKFGGEEWINSVESLAKYRGIQVGTKYAEAFYLMKYFME
ncbi:MAG: PIG-L deacetylase family protein [Promethearchaeota archaeon]